MHLPPAIKPSDFIAAGQAELFLVAGKDLRRRIGIGSVQHVTTAAATHLAWTQCLLCMQQAEVYFIPDPTFCIVLCCTVYRSLPVQQLGRILETTVLS